MPDFDDSFLGYCERTERKRKHSYNFASARSSSVSLEKGGQKHPHHHSSRSNLLATAKNYSKTLPRSFRKNLQKISQFIRESDGDLHFYDLNHNEVSAEDQSVERKGGGRKRGDKVLSVIEYNLQSPPEAVELLANRRVEEERLQFGPEVDVVPSDDEEVESANEEEEAVEENNSK